MPKKMKLVPTTEYKKLQDAQNFKTANSLYAIARENEKFETGIHWDGINSRNLKHTTYNFINQIVSIKSASILANELSMQRTSDAVDKEDEHVQDAIKAFNLADQKNWERLDMDAMNEQIVYDGSIQGLGVSYWYWDKDIVTGNKHKVIGDINGQLVDSINYYVANPSEVDAQKQPWCKIVIYMTVNELREYAIKKGVSKEQAEMIAPDEQEKVYRAFEKNDTETTQPKGDQIAQLLINFEKREGKVYKSESTKAIKIEEWKDIEMTRYPIAIYPYKTRKSFIYAEAEMTRYIQNQVVANLQMSMRHLSVALMAIPRVVVNENMTGTFSNAVGAVHKARIPAMGSLDNVIKYVQPASIPTDLDKSVDDAVERTQQLAGVGQTLQATARPENAAALLTQIKQANVPIESYKRRLYKYIEDVAEIWLEFYKTKYNMTRMLADKEEEVVEFTGTDFADVYMTTATDVGPSTQWSEITSMQALMDLWDRQIISNPDQVISRLPENLIKNQDELVSEIQTEEELNMLMQFIFQGLDNAEELMQMFDEADMEGKQEMLQAMMPQQPEVMA